MLVGMRLRCLRRASQSQASRFATRHVAATAADRPTKKQTDERLAPLLEASASEIHQAITERFDSGLAPPSSFLKLLSDRVDRFEDAALVLNAHRRYVDFQKNIDLDHIDGLLSSSCRLQDWDTLHDALAESRRLQLHFRSAKPLELAFRELAKHKEYERLEQLHALLPTMAIDSVGTAPIHLMVIRDLLLAGELGAAARVLDAAVALATSSDNPMHRIRPQTFARVANAQLRASDPTAVARTVLLAVANMKADRKVSSGASAKSDEIKSLSHLVAAAVEAAAAAPDDEPSAPAGPAEGAEGTEAAEAAEVAEVAVSVAAPMAAVLAAAKAEGGVVGSGSTGVVSSGVDAVWMRLI